MEINSKEIYAADGRLLFFEQLKRQEAVAIRRLVHKLAEHLTGIPGMERLSAEDREELHSDAVVVTLRNIETGKFAFEDADPSTYAIGVAKNLLLNRLRKKRLDTEPLNAVGELPGFDPEVVERQKERQLFIGALLGKLETPCRQLIRWRYFDELTDEEILHQKLSHFTTLNSLKSQRCKCLRKLADMARKYKHL